MAAAVDRWHAAGVVVHPVKADGSKALVAVRGAGIDGPWGWGLIARGEFPPLTPDQVVDVVRRGRADGIAVICGPVSGGIEMVEIEGRARDLLPKLRDHAQQLGVLHLLERLSRGFTEESPSGGLHFLMRVVDGPATTRKLASRPDPDSPDGVLVLAETKGAGGITVAFPSAGRTHKSGRPYRLLRGGPETIADFTVAERDALYAAFASLDEMPPPVQPASPRPPRLHAVAQRPGDVSPGDDFNQRTSWDDLLLPMGWTCCGPRGDRRQWRRPGKADGISATTSGEVFYAFSTSTNLPTGKGLSKFAVYAHAHHGGDFSAAAADLVRLGFGSTISDASPAVALEVPPSPTGPARNLDDYRRELADAVVDAVATPGLHLFRAPTGAGKSYATAAALRGVASSLTVLPDHANVRERTADLVRLGIDAVAYPEPTDDNCRDLAGFREVQSLGLTPGAVLCPTCPFKDGCLYRAAVKAAEQSQHRVATHERLRRSSAVAKDAAVVVIDESPENVIRPTVVVAVKELGRVQSLSLAIRDHFYSVASPEERSFAGAMLEVIALVNQVCTGIAGAGQNRISLPVPQDVPQNWQLMVHRMIRASGTADLDADALTLVTRAAAGQLVGMEVVTDQTTRTTAGDDGTPVADRRLHHYLVGNWLPAISRDAAVVMLDATAAADDIAAVAGRPVSDGTPEGTIPVMHQVVQVPTDITRGASSRTVASVVAAFLEDHPTVRRLGIVGHQPHVRDLVGTADAPGMLGHLLDRVAKSCWFGAGPDRASNQWHAECDHVLILGTPRANPGGYRRWLAQHGLHDAARLEDGGWTSRPWSGTTVDGNQVVVPRSGYRDASWDRAYRAITRAGLNQVVGRGRASLPEGIPVTVVSNEPLGLPIRPPLATSPASILEVVQVVRDLLGQPAGSAKSPIRDPYSTNCASRVRSAQVVAALAERFGIQDRAAQVRVAAAVAAGMLARFGRGWLGMPVVVADVPQEAPNLPPPVQAGAGIDLVAQDLSVASTTCTTANPVHQDAQELVDERAAIMAVDGGIPPDDARHRALVDVLRLPAAPAEDVPPVLVAGVDHVAVAVRSDPFVAAVLERFPGVVRRVIQDPQVVRPSPQPASPGDRSRCVCGHVATTAVVIHGGRSTRHDCARCDRFRFFTDWYTRSLPQDRDPTPPPIFPPPPADWTPLPVAAVV